MLRIFMNLLLDGFNYFPEASKNAGCWGRVGGVPGRIGGNPGNASPALRRLGAGRSLFAPSSLAVTSTYFLSLSLLFLFCTPPLSSGHPFFSDGVKV